MFCVAIEDYSAQGPSISCNYVWFHPEKAFSGSYTHPNPQLQSHLSHPIASRSPVVTFSGCQPSNHDTEIYY